MNVYDVYPMGAHRMRSSGLVYYNTVYKNIHNIQRLV